MYSDDMSPAREKENQNIIQKEISWRFGIKGIKLPMVEKNVFENQ